MDLDISQQRAVELMRSARLGLVTGPPGSGKTTTLRAAIAALDGESFALAAPTGKAARRMASATGCEARTVHRLLGFEGRGFAVNEHTPLEVGVVFVDEASMIDYELGCALMAGTTRSRLILIGDADQLPPVGMGRMFGDLVDATDRLGHVIPIARLATQHRAAEGSWVIRNAPKVLTGGPLEMKACADMRWVERDDAAEVATAVTELVTADPSCVVLAPQYAGACGCDALNTALDPIVNTRGPLRDGEPTLSRGPNRLPLRAGMHVMQTANNYRLDVMNGEIGIVVALDPVTVVFGELGRTVVYETRSHVDALVPAYALTVHKTQGSEFGHVVVVIHSAHTRMLSRSILYTAITRAKARVTIVGDAKGLTRALRTDAARRQTSLVERLEGGLAPAEDSL